MYKIHWRAVGQVHPWLFGAFGALMGPLALPPNLVAAAYGDVPFDECPGQVARDGEDYAVFMTTILAEMPFELYIDCQGTLSAQ